ncbi:regulatory protein GemA [Shewanella sp. GutCb]|uniref:gp16 family protein n=1 Tax=Shewanella sp. GutCb TaxID=2058315 RepID=UPI000C7BE0EB|nr:regulatory protein GemA [Shewanella sp. GutCb]PKG74215.1 regulatory protein GemA [Shewanella sp. GutCb]
MHPYVPAPNNSHKKRLITLINVAKANLNLDEQLYRVMLKTSTGKDSLRAMSLPELEQALEGFKQKGFKPVTKKSKNQFKGRLSPASGQSKVPQIDKIRAIWITMYQHNIINDRSETALDAYVRRITKGAKAEKTHTAEKEQGVDSTAWLTETLANRVLESLKQWHKRVLLQRLKDSEQLLHIQHDQLSSYNHIVELYLMQANGGLSYE